MLPMHCPFANRGYLTFKRYLLLFDLRLATLSFIACGDVVVTWF